MADGPREEALRRLQREVVEGVEYNGQPNGPTADLEALPFSTWRKRPRPPREELLGPAVVRGERLVLGAETGAGKSTLTWWMVKALATGGTFLGWKANRPCRVLIVDAEQSDHDLERLMDETHLGEVDNCYLVHVPDGLSLNDNRAEEMRLELILSEGQFDVVVLDPLYKLHTGDANDERQAVALMRMFDRWRTRFNFALILPSHMRKPQGRRGKDEFSMHDIFGASAFLRGAEVVLGIKLLGDGQSQLYFFKRRSPGLPVRTSWMLRYNRHHGFSLSQGGGGKAALERDEVRQKLRELLEIAGGAGVELSVAMAEIGKSRSVTYDLLKEIGAGSIPMPGHRSKKLYLAPGIRPNQAEMDIMAIEDDDDD